MGNNLPSNINSQLTKLLESSNTDLSTIIEFVKDNCKNYQLAPKHLGMIFEKYAQPTEGYSKDILIDDLVEIHPNFRSTNGNSWARSDSSWLGKKYLIIRTHQNGSVYSVKLDGFNTNSVNKYRSISSSIINALKGKKCTILDIISTKGMEIDHKNGKYDSLSNIDLSKQKTEDFQVLSKAANDAKRQHCKICKDTGERYDAKQLGYSSSFIVGNKNSKTCIGCYWYDPHHFNKTISKDYKKPDE